GSPDDGGPQQRRAAQLGPARPQAPEQGQLPGLGGQDDGEGVADQDHAGDERDHAGDEEDLGVPALGGGGVAGPLGGQVGPGERLVAGAEGGGQAVAEQRGGDAGGGGDLQVADPARDRGEQPR